METKHDNLVTLLFLIVSTAVVLLTLAKPSFDEINIARDEALVAKVTDTYLLEGPDVFLEKCPKLFSETLNDGEFPFTGLLDDWDSVFKYNEVDITSYTIEFIQPGVAEILTYSKEGTPNFPRVLFQFETDINHAVITSYRLSRMQPFSVYDAEYREVWS